MKPALLAEEQDPRWIAVTERNPDSDGQFFYAVKTTGIYCRPTCPARLPRREHVAFYVTHEEAERAGYRACLRCRPRQLSLDLRHAALMQAACRVIERSATPPSLNQLAAHAGLSAYHFQRTFKRCIGVTPKAYAKAQREQRLRTLLAEGKSVTEAIYDAGYPSASRFYEQAARIVGMRPAAYRSGGTDIAIRFAVGECGLGAILVAQSSLGICAILLGDDPDALLQDLEKRFPHADLIGADPDFERVVAYVIGFVQAPRLEFGLPLDIRGTVFQQRVWQALQQIPPGCTMSYTELAHRIGMPKAVRAVAAACAANALAVAIPCHRVVRSDGTLAGYRWKIERKRLLLENEANTEQASATRADATAVNAKRKRKTD